MKAQHKDVFLLFRHRQIKADPGQVGIALQQRLIIVRAQQFAGFFQDIFQAEAKNAAVPQGAPADKIPRFLPARLFMEG